MKLEVKVIPHAKKDLIIQDGEIYKVYVTAPAVDGKANKAVIGLLAEHFQTRKMNIEIVRGLNSRHKIINVT